MMTITQQACKYTLGLEYTQRLVDTNLLKQPQQSLYSTSPSLLCTMLAAYRPTSTASQHIHIHIHILTASCACCTDLEDFISGVCVSGTGRALSQQGQQASCDEALPGRRLTGAGPGQAVCGEHGHSHCQDWDAGPVLGHQARCGASSGEDHYKRCMYLHL